MNHVYEHVPFYRESFDGCGLSPGDLRSLDDLAKYPFTEKDDLRDHYPYGLFAVDLRDIVRIHASSGTAVELSNKSGELSRVLKVLEKNDVNVEYIYAFSGLPLDKAALIFRFDDAARAVACLADAGINVYAQVDLQ